MDTKQRYLIAGAAAAALVIGGAGVFAGRTVLAPRAAPEKAERQEKTVDTVHAKSADDAETKPGGEVKSDDDKPKDGVHMEDEAVGAARIELLTLAPGSLSAEIAAQGTVMSAPDGEAILTAGAPGTIAQIRKRPGDPVARGETVAMVTSAEAAGISAALSTSKTKLTLAQSAYEREQRLYDSKITARQDLEAAQAELGEAQAEFKRSEAAAKAARVSPDGASVSIASPIAGRITSVSEAAKLGAYVAPETVLFKVADPARIQVQAAVPATEARRIAPGDPAEIEAATGQKIAAKVRSVTPGVDVESRSATVVLALSGPLDAVQPGQFVRTRIKPKSSAGDEGRFVLPEEAVQSVAGHDVVFVRDGELFKPTSVRLGGRSGGRIEIESGLSAGQIVAGKNAFLLKAELGKSNEED